MSRITLKDIAQRADVSVATVSMALKDHRRISRATCERIQALAKEMGYQPDAALSALARYRSEHHGGSVGWEILGLADNWPRRDEWCELYNYRKLRDALKSHCARHGFILEERWVGDAKPGVSHPVFKEWYHRGVRGVFVAPPPPTEKPISIEVPPGVFQVITFGPVWLYPSYHSVQSDYLENFRRTWDELWRLGYRRVGLHIPESISWRTGHAWTSLYTFKEIQLFPPKQQIPVCKVEVEGGRRAFLAWYRKWKPEVVVSSTDWVAGVLHEAGYAIPEQVGCVNLAATPGNIAGMDPAPEAQATSAFNLMRTFLHETILSRSGDSPLNVYVPGTWKEGGSLQSLVRK